MSGFHVGPHLHVLFIMTKLSHIIGCSGCGRIFLTYSAFISHFENVESLDDDEGDEIKCNHPEFGPGPRSKRREEVVRRLIDELEDVDGRRTKNKKKRKKSGPKSRLWRFTQPSVDFKVKTPVKEDWVTIFNEKKATPKAKAKKK